MWPRGLAHSSSCSLASRARARQRRRQRPRDTLCPRGGLGDATEGARTAHSSGACHRATPAQRAIDPASQPTAEQPSAAPCLESAANPRTAVEGLLEISRATIYTCISKHMYVFEDREFRNSNVAAAIPASTTPRRPRGLAGACPPVADRTRPTSPRTTWAEAEAAPAPRVPAEPVSPTHRGPPHLMGCAGLDILRHGSHTG